MVQHYFLGFRVIPFSPEFPLDKRVSNRDLSLRRVRLVKTRRPNDSFRLQIDDRKGSFGFHGFIEEFLEDITLVPVGFGMLRPKQRVARRRKERIEVPRTQRPKLDEIAF